MKYLIDLFRWRFWSTYCDPGLFFWFCLLLPLVLRPFGMVLPAGLQSQKMDAKH